MRTLAQETTQLTLKDGSKEAVGEANTRDSGEGDSKQSSTRFTEAFCG